MTCTVSDRKRIEDMIFLLTNPPVRRISNGVGFSFFFLEGMTLSLVNPKKKLVEILTFLSNL